MDVAINTILDEFESLSGGKDRLIVFLRAEIVSLREHIRHLEERLAYCSCGGDDDEA